MQTELADSMGFVVQSVWRNKAGSFNWWTVRVSSNLSSRELAAVTYRYDTLGQPLSESAEDAHRGWSYTKTGQMAVAENGELRVEYAYDAQGRLIRETETGACCGFRRAGLKPGTVTTAPIL